MDALRGAFADRRDPRRLALASMAVQTVSVFAILVMLSVNVWGLAACYGLQGAANALWPPARQRWLYAVIPEERRAAANAALGSVSGMMTIIGAALGGILSAWSTTAAIAVAALVQLAAVLPLVLLKRTVPGEAGAKAPANRTMRADLIEGFTALRHLPLARSVIWVGIAWGFIGGAYNVLLAAYVTKQLHGSGVMLGSFYVVDGLRCWSARPWRPGSTPGAIWASTRSPMSSRESAGVRCSCPACLPPGPRAWPSCGWPAE
ncbi:MFS transporter [Streptacidiphilus sp. 4-A2]|nr:MFS transporter [Streptacidiphilus sp. 4-A2]